MSRSQKAANYWRAVRLSQKNLRSSTISEVLSVNDERPYANFEIGDLSLKGLLDSGATISCFGTNALSLAKTLNLNVKKISSGVNTADGSRQSVVGYVEAAVTYSGKSKLIRFYLVPSLSQRIYLGIDFWNSFGLKPMVVSEIESEANPNEHFLTIFQKSELQKVINLFPSSAVYGLGRTSILQHSIVTNEALPVKQRHYPVSPAIQNRMYTELDRMLEMGVIEESQSPWNSPMVLVNKANGKPRLCLDSRAINKVTVKDAYPLPIIDGLLSRLGETYFISSIDLKDAFWQIELDPESREKTAFTVPGRPHYQFARMPFGLCNAAQTMCRLMDKVIGSELREHVFVYIDDLMVVSTDFNSHLARLRKVAERLRMANLTINVEKSKFMLKEVRYLGYIVGNGCLKTDPAKVQAISDFPIPTTVRQVRRFLGMSGWYQRFIADYAEMATPLTNLIGKEKFVWTPEAQIGFDKLKTALTSAPVLCNPDFTKPFVIQCDASSVGVGSVLYQLSEDGSEHPIAFMSKKLNSAQRNYSVTELECYAAVLSVKRFRPYVEGMEFKVVTDHASLKWLMNQKDLSGRLARWSLKLQSFDFTIEHRKGSRNVVPDTLSRTYMEELVQSPDICLKIDLHSPHFQGEAYTNKATMVRENPSRFPNLIVKDHHILIKTWSHVDGVTEDSSWKLWVPEGLTDSLMASAHNPPMSAHGGIAKTINSLRRFYYWPRMAIQIRDYVSKCEICKEVKAPNVTLRPPMGKAFKSERPWQRLYIDLLGPYPRSKRGHTMLLIVLDQFSKFICLHPLRKATSATIIDYLEANVFHLFSTPESILSDNGVQFVSREFKSFLERYGVKHITTATHSPKQMLQKG